MKPKGKKVKYFTEDLEVLTLALSLDFNVTKQLKLNFVSFRFSFLVLWKCEFRGNLTT